MPLLVVLLNPGTEMVGVDDVSFDINRVFPDNYWSKSELEEVEKNVLGLLGGLYSLAVSREHVQQCGPPSQSPDRLAAEINDLRRKRRRSDPDLGSKRQFRVFDDQRRTRLSQALSFGVSLDR